MRSRWRAEHPSENGAVKLALQVGIVTPYLDQRRFIQETLKRNLKREESMKIEVDTVDSFQVRACLFIALSRLRLLSHDTQYIKRAWGSLKNV